MKKKQRTDQEIAMRISTVSIVANLLLSAAKLAAGILGKSGAMISDAVHSASDVFSTIIVIIGVKVSGKKSDKSHQYGHERMECVASIILSVILALTGLGIGFTGIKKIVMGNYGNLEIPTALPLIAALVSIAVKEAMYWYTRNGARKINSGALMADAWHHRSDALSSVGAFVGILGARMGLPIMDPLASVVICVFIEKAAFDIFKDAIDKMVDKAFSDEDVNTIRELVLAQEGVIGVDVIRTRLFGSKGYVDVEFSADSNLTLKEAHKLAEVVHDKIEDEMEQVKHCMVHVNPYSGESPEPEKTKKQHK